MAPRPGKSVVTKIPDIPSPADASTLPFPTGWFGVAWFGSVAQMGTELAAFIAGRINEDVKTQHALLNCKTLADVQAVQTDFITRAVDQYTAETGKLVDLSQEMMMARGMSHESGDGL